MLHQRTLELSEPTEIGCRGHLIVLEGVDGSGKTTLSRALLRDFQSRGLSAAYRSFPGQDPGSLGKHVHDLHHGRVAEIDEISATSLQLLHISAHVDQIERNIATELQDGVTIILDRFWWSTWIYGVAAGVPTPRLRAMLDLELDVWGRVSPSVVFLVKRLSSSTAPEYRAMVREYDKLAAKESKRHAVVHIANDGDLDDTLAQVRSSLEGIVFHKHTGSTRPPAASNNCNSPRAPYSFTKLSPLKPTVVFDSYWHFATERQAMFFRRVDGEQPPWTADAILSEYKFTNAYRASDRVSQYLIRNVIYQGDQSANETFFRTILFKLFNRIETWELLLNHLGSVTFAEYCFSRYDSILTDALDRGQRIYSAAYIMPSGGRGSNDEKKHRMHLRLIEQMMSDELPSRIAGAVSMKSAYELLRSYRSIGTFLAYQYVTDLNYSKIIDFSEMDFVVPGPGARDGIRKCFSDYGGLNDSEIIKVITERQETEFEQRGLEFRSLWGRPLQLIDCQNLFCEVDKYARVKHPEFCGSNGRKRIKQKYRASPDPISYWYPPKWGLNDRVTSGERDVSWV